MAVSAGSLADTLRQPLGQGIILGLILGKVLGISLCCWLGLKLKWGELADDLRFSHVVGLGLLAGMGFSMSLFIGNLAFGADQQALVQAKTAIVIASVFAGVLGYCWLRFIAPASPGIAAHQSWRS